MKLFASLLVDYMLSLYQRPNQQETALNWMLDKKQASIPSKIDFAN
jgi:hypothetical protein